jgi:hypothetical protein
MQVSRGKPFACVSVRVGIQDMDDRRRLRLTPEGGRALSGEWARIRDCVLGPALGVKVVSRGCWGWSSVGGKPDAEHRWPALPLLTPQTRIYTLSSEK